MAVTITADEAQNQFDQVLEAVRVEQREYVISLEGIAVARLSPILQTPPVRVPGMDKGKVWVSPDFNDPLPDKRLDSFGR
jgi:antitoxin (DNA-binding transcriptional repressor) of toxin-antitoxin stability system